MTKRRGWGVPGEILYLQRYANKKPSIFLKDVTNIAIPSMLSSRNSPSPLICYLLHNFRLERLSDVCANGWGRECHGRDSVNVRCNQFAFAFVPCGQQFSGRGSADKSWMSNTCKTDSRYVSRGSIDACSGVELWVDCERACETIPLRSQMAFAALLLNSRAAE